MNTWISKYYTEQDISHQSKVEQWINKLTNKQEDKNIETKVLQIEKEYIEKLKELHELCNKPESIEIIKKGLSLDILQKELEIIKLLTKYSLQNNSLDYKFFMTCLNILLELSECLRNRVGQKEIVHEVKNYNENNISRCSYKFCTYRDGCSYNYNSKSKNLCYQDHYVHSMVSADLRILIDYVTQKYSSSNVVLHNKEILKTINTLSFVIGHMETELKTRCFYLPKEEWESCHIVKNK
jgi:hypothetical protein